jgi:hypothetical protein
LDPLCINLYYCCDIVFCYTCKVSMSTCKRNIISTQNGLLSYFGEWMRKPAKMLVCWKMTFWSFSLTGSSYDDVTSDGRCYWNLKILAGTHFEIFQVFKISQQRRNDVIATSCPLWLVSERCRCAIFPVGQILLNYMLSVILSASFCNYQLCIDVDT